MAGFTPLLAQVADVGSATADFSNDNGWILLLKSVAIIVFMLLSVLFAIWFERKIVARMQIRPGPNVHGPFGLLQPIADAMKLLLKEDITCLLYTSDAADEEDSVDLGGRRIIKK